MAVISQLHPVNIGDFIKSSEWNSEFLQLIELLSGVSSTHEVKIVSSAPGAAATLIVDRGDSGSVARFTKGGSTVGSVNSEGPTSTTDLTTVTYVGNRKNYLSWTGFLGGDPAVGDRSAGRFIVPANGTFVVTELVRYA